MRYCNGMKRLALSLACVMTIAGDVDVSVEMHDRPGAAATQVAQGFSPAIVITQASDNARRVIPLQ
jgi:hypothetical protein